ncbi:MAG TPA: hypothetical protein VFO19_04860 [Vicinamibacterales bacterium]|nr:hypothetical protein [Vicinamibacterales bacterium]
MTFTFPTHAPRRRSLDRLEAAIAALVLYGSIGALAVMVLVETASIASGTLIAIAAVLVGATVITVVAEWRVSAPTPVRDWLIALILVICGGAIYSRPVEPIVDAGDASVYLAIRRVIAQEGGLGVIDPVIARLPEGTAGELFSRDRRPPPLLDYFPGGIQVHDDGRLEAGFFHLAPALMAAADVAIGGRAGDYVNPTCSTLSVLLVFLLARRLSGSSWSALAVAAIVGVAFAQIWFAWLPMPEVVAQAAVVAAVLYLLAATDGAAPIASLAAGLATGVAAFTRIDTALMVAAPLAAIAALRWITVPASRAPMQWYLAAALPACGFAGWHAWAFAGAYSERIVFILFRSGWTPAGRPAITIAIVAAIGLLWWMRGRLGGVKRLAAPMAAVAAIAFVAWVVVNRDRVGANPFVEMIGWPGLALIGAGCVALFIGRDADRALPLAGVVLASAILSLESPRDVAPMPMPLRRFVPVLLPLGMVIGGHALAVAGRSRAGRVLATGVAAAIGVLIALPSAALRTTPPYSGVRAALVEAAGAVPVNALTFVHPRSPRHLGLALRFEIGREVLLVSGGRGGGAVGRIAGAAIDTGRPVRVAAPATSGDGEDLSALDFRGFMIEPAGTLAIRFAAFQPDGAALPTRVVPSTPAVDLYRVERPPSAGIPLPIRADIGAHDFGVRGGGFFDAEVMQGVSARWTNGDARVVLPPLAADVTARLVVRYAAGWPAALPAPPVTLAIDDVVVGRVVTVSRGFAEYAVPLDADAIDRLRRGAVVLISSPTFVPAAHGAPGDTRTLGIALDWLSIENQPGPPPRRPLSARRLPITSIAPARSPRSSADRSGSRGGR